MSETEDLVCAFLLDGKGGGKRLDWDGVRAHKPEDGPLWIHLNRMGKASREWLRKESGIEPLVVEMLLASESRPRCTVLPNSLVLNLRGVNLNPGADPEDMVSLRLWVSPERMVSVRHRRLMAVADVQKELDENYGPHSLDGLMVDIALKLVERMDPVITELDDQVDGLEDQVLTAESQQLRTDLGEARRTAISLRRYIAPQREALSRLLLENPAWVAPTSRNRLQEVADQVTRYVEDLDSARDRAAVIYDELSNRLSEQMNRNMYLLSVVAAIFLPLGLLTGLLGINVAGIPGSETPWAFAAVCTLLFALVGLEIWILKRFRLF